MGIGESNLNLIVKFLEAKTDTGNRPPRTRRAGETVNPPAELLPQLRRGPLDMGFAIGGVVKLVRPYCPRRFIRQAARGMHKVIGVSEFGRRHGDQLGTQSAQRRHFLSRLIVRHDNNRLIAQRIGDQGDADPCVARCALDNGPARLQIAARLCIADNPQRRAVLHTGAGIGKFALGKNVASRCFAGPGQADNRGLADKIERIAKRSSNVHRPPDKPQRAPRQRR